MSRPNILHVGGTLYWTIRLYNSSGALVDADSTPTVSVLKNGSSTGDSVTVSKRSATTGIYDCSYNPASEAEGDQYTIEESVTISSTVYQSSWEVTVVAVDQGQTILNRIGAFTGTGVNTILGFFQAIMFSDATEPSDAGDTFAASLEEVKLTASSVTVAPLQATSIRRVNGEDINYFVGETIAQTVAITDADGVAVDLSAKTLSLIIESKPNLADVQTVTPSVGGASNNQITFTNNANVTKTARTLKWVLRDTAGGDEVFGRGDVIVSYAPR